MSMQKVWFVVMVIFAVIGIHQWAYAQNITVDFIKDDGTAACAQKSGATPLTIGGACGPISISANAKVDMIDGNSDFLRLSGGTITATSPVNNFHIIFGRQFQAGPTTSAGPPTILNVNYKTTENSIFSPGRDGNSITAAGFVTNVPTDPEQTMGSVSYTVSSGVGNSSKFADKLWPRTVEGELSGDRVLRVDLSFKLQNANDTLNLTNGVKLYNAAPGNPPDGTDIPTPQPTPPTQQKGKGHGDKGKDGKGKD